MKGKRRGAGYFLQKHTTFAPLDFWRMHSKAKFSLLCTIFLIFSQRWLKAHITILSIDKYKRICKISTPLVFINWVQYIHESNIIFHFAIKCYKLKNGKNFYYLYLVGIYGDQVQKKKTIERNDNNRRPKLLLTGSCWYLVYFSLFIYCLKQNLLIFFMNHVSLRKKAYHYLLLIVRVYCNLV